MCSVLLKIVLSDNADPYVNVHRAAKREKRKRNITKNNQPRATYYLKVRFWWVRTRVRNIAAALSYLRKVTGKFAEDLWLLELSGFQDSVYSSDSLSAARDFPASCLIDK